MDHVALVDRAGVVGPRPGEQHTLARPLPVAKATPDSPPGWLWSGRARVRRPPLLNDLVETVRRPIVGCQLNVGMVPNRPATWPSRYSTKICSRGTAPMLAHLIGCPVSGCQTMRADEYIRLQAACVAMARQCQGLDEQARWAKLADAAFVAAHAGLAMARNRGAGREPERKIPVAIQARFSDRTAQLLLTISRSQQKDPSSGGSRGQV
jgi:hypothetical protein